jgi:hypothetical protein
VLVAAETSGVRDIPGRLVDFVMANTSGTVQVP